MSSDKIAVVTVHGTNDTAEGLDGPKWFQRGSAFAQRLLPRLAQHGVDAEIVPHLWSGANSAQARERGARALAKRIRELHRTHASVHVIGHSHGGNVANEAATMLRWRLHKRVKPLLASISTVGTPFFRVRLAGSRQMVAFLILCVLSVLALIAFGGVLLLMQSVLHLDPALYAQDFIRQQEAVGETYTQAQLDAYVAEQMSGARLLRNAALVPSVLTPLALIVLPVAAYQGVRSIRIQRRQNPDAKIFSIWHPNDEAISFLKRVEQLEITPFQRGAFWRASGTSGLGLGVPAALAMLLPAAITIIALLSGVEITNDTYIAIGSILGIKKETVLALVGDLGGAELAVFTTAFALITPALAFTVVYLIVRFVHGVFVEIVGRPILNNIVRGALRGMAFGRDGDVRLDAIATHSHNYGVRPMELSGDVEGRMRTASAAAASALIDKYRWSLFAIDSDKDTLSKLSEDAQTWKSLIHTTYFDQPEVVDALADYIAENVGRQRAR
jgi:hypothetical protein